VKRPAGYGTILLCALAVAALGFAAVAAVSWWNASHDSSLDFARSRDAVAVAARQDIVVVNTLDYRNVDGGLRNWLAATTGTLHDQLSHVDPAARSQIQSAETVTTGKVLAAAVSQLDDRAGTATVLATVEITVTPAGGKAAVKRNRFSATMTRLAGDDWKLSDLQQVPVSIS